MTTKLGFSTGGRTLLRAAEADPTAKQSAASRPSSPIAVGRRAGNAGAFLRRCMELGTAALPGSKTRAPMKFRNARRRSGRAELFVCVAEVLDRRARGFAPLELLAVAVDPDHGHVHLQQRRHVRRVVRADVHPAFLAAYPAGALFEVNRVRLVAAHLLGGDDEVEFGAQVAAGDAEELVVDVGDDP